MWFEGYSFCHTFCRFDDSAQYYAQTRMSFEEVALKFIETKKDVALRVYLEKKLKSYKPAEVRQCFLWQEQSFSLVSPKKYINVS